MDKPNRDNFGPGDAGTKAYEDAESAWRAEERKKGEDSKVSAKKQFGEAKEGTELLVDPRTGRAVGARKTVTGADRASAEATESLGDRVKRLKLESQKKALESP